MTESQVVQQNKTISFDILNTFIFSFPLYLAYHSSLTLKNTNSKVVIFIISILLLLFLKTLY